jgi:hypothetical protein
MQNPMGCFDFLGTWQMPFISILAYLLFDSFRLSQLACQWPEQLIMFVLNYATHSFTHKNKHV